MKRLIITFAILIGASLAAFAQPKSAGLRFGGTGLDVTYQHYMGKDRFAEGNLGLDFGVKNSAGVKVTGIYNMILARPAWTDTGSWAIYAGPGVSLGYVYDMVRYDVMDSKIDYPDNGFMLALAAQVGIEYNFDIPLQLSIDLRPMIGMHINDGKFRDPATNIVAEGFESKIGFYNNGLLGLTPTISVRYRF